MIKQHANIDFTTYGVDEIAPIALTIVSSMTTYIEVSSCGWYISFHTNHTGKIIIFRN